MKRKYKKRKEYKIYFKRLVQKNASLISSYVDSMIIIRARNYGEAQKEFWKDKSGTGLFSFIVDIKEIKEQE